MWPCYVLLLELLVPRDLFISYDLYLLVLPYSFHLVPLFEIFKVSFFLLFHRHFTWCHPWGSSSFSSLWFFHWNFTWHHPGGLSGYLVCICIILVGAYCFCCLVGYLCVTCARPWYVYFSASNYCPLFLFVDCCFDPLGMMSNNYARFLSAVWCVSLIFAKVAFCVGCFNASIKSETASVSSSEYDTLGILIFWGRNSTT